MSRRVSPTVRGFATALAWMSFATSVLAQTSDSESASAGLSEVVVTATRREERLQDVPISVSAFSQEKIDAQGLRNVDDVVRLTPDLTVSRYCWSSG